jgi:hypothetical protein
VALSDISLIWMLENAEKHGLRLKPGWQADLKPDPLGEIHESRAGLWDYGGRPYGGFPRAPRSTHRCGLAWKRKMDYSPMLPARYTIVDSREQASAGSGVVPILLEGHWR